MPDLIKIPGHDLQGNPGTPDLVNDSGCETCCCDCQVLNNTACKCANQDYGQLSDSPSAAVTVNLTGAIPAATANIVQNNFSATCANSWQCPSVNGTYVLNCASFGSQRVMRRATTVICSVNAVQDCLTSQFFNLPLGFANILCITELVVEYGHCPSRINTLCGNGVQFLDVHIFVYLISYTVFHIPSNASQIGNYNVILYNSFGLPGIGGVVQGLCTFSQQYPFQKDWYFGRLYNLNPVKHWWYDPATCSDACNLATSPNGTQQNFACRCDWSVDCSWCERDRSTGPVNRGCVYNGSISVA